MCSGTSVYVLVLAEGVVKLSASVSAESQFITFGLVSFLAKTRNFASVCLREHDTSFKWR